jgi:ADP-heptose:LPS heptosyltransferase
LLVAAPERLDDACFSDPAIRSLMAMPETGQVHVLCVDWQRSLWRTMPGVEVIGYREGAGARAIRAEIEAGDAGFSAAVLWENSRAARAVRKAKIEPRFGPDVAGLAGELTTPLKIARRPGPVEHRVRDFLLLAKALGAKPFVQENFEPVDLGIEVEADSLAFVPDSDFGPSHLWPLDRWLETARLAAARLGRPVTVVDRDDGPMAGQLADALGELAVLEKSTTMAEDLYLIGRHRVVACVDGTAPHLAAHVGATCVVLFGPNEPSWRRPLGKRHRVLRRHVACSPCFRPDCPLDHRCMDEIPAASVISLLERLLP